MNCNVGILFSAQMVWICYVWSLFAYNHHTYTTYVH